MAETHEQQHVHRLRGTAATVGVTFQPEQLGWNAGSRLVDFISRYAGLFFDAARTTYLDREEVEDAINYILLELIDNALKYGVAGDIDVRVEVRANELCFAVVNPIATGAVARLESQFQELYSDDPADLLVRRIEENAANPESVGSGLGLLTILSDYGAFVGWHFHDGARPDRTRLTITTRFPVYRSER